MKTNKGFTLIELLVVIAIIGILSSVVLASLNTARDKGSDAAIKANLANARAQAELFYDDQSPNSYAGVCLADDGIAAAVDAATEQSGTVGCIDSADGWSLTAALSETGTFYCVDSTGAASTTGAGVTDGTDWAVGDDACDAL